MDLLTLAMAKAYTDKKQKETSATVPTKTSQLENDSGYITDSKVFIATHDVTTYEEIMEAYKAGKIVQVLIPLETKTVLANLTMPNNNGNNQYNFTFSGDENGIAHYANINSDTKKWNYWNYEYTKKLDYHDNAINSLTARATDAEKHYSDYKYVEIAANGKFQLREKGIYIFGGSDYDLNLCDSSGNTIGKTESLVIVVFCTEADVNGNFRVYVMQNYKTSLGISSMDGMPYANFTKDYYVHNTNAASHAYVYYMRQNVV